MNRHSRPITRSSNAWAALLLVVLAWLGWVLSRNIQGPWISDVDYNGAVWSQAAHNILRAGLFRDLPIYITCLLLAAPGISGELRARALEKQTRILGHKAVESANLIPELGAAIRESFSPDTYVLCNFPGGPQLSYYAQRELIGELREYRFWKRYLQGSPKPVGGVVWMGSSTAEDIVTELPVGTKRFVKLGDVSFCFWRSGY
jgi:hypothetical protein